MKPFLQALAVLSIFNALAVVFFVSNLQKSEKDQETALEAIFGGSKNLRNLTEAENVQVSKLISHLPYPLPAGETVESRFSLKYGYIVEQGPVDASEDLQAILKENFSDPKNYTYDGKIPACVFTPNFLISFTNGSEKIDLLTSVSDCSEFRVFVNGERLPFSTKRIGSQEFGYTVYPGFGYFKDGPLEIRHALWYYIRWTII